MISPKNEETVNLSIPSDVPEEKEKGSKTKFKFVFPTKSNQSISLKKESGPTVQEFKIDKSLILNAPVTFQKKYRQRLKGLIDHFQVQPNFPGQDVLSDFLGNAFIVDGKELSQVKVDNESRDLIFKEPFDGFAVIDDFEPADDAWTKLEVFKTETFEPKAENKAIAAFFGGSAIFAWNANSIVIRSPLNGANLEFSLALQISKPAFGAFGYLAFLSQTEPKIIIYHFITKQVTEVAIPIKMKEITIVRAFCDEIFIFNPKMFIRMTWKNPQQMIKNRLHYSCFEVSFKLGNIYIGLGNVLRISNYQDEYLVNKLAFDCHISSLLLSKNSKQLYILCSNDKDNSSKIFIYDCLRNKLVKHIDFKFRVERLFVNTNNSILFHLNDGKIFLNELKTNYIDKEYAYMSPIEKTQKPIVRMFSPRNSEILLLADYQLYSILPGKGPLTLNTAPKLCANISERKENASLSIYEEEIIIDHGDNRLTILYQNHNFILKEYKEHLQHYKAAKKLYKNQLKRLRSANELVSMESKEFENLGVTTQGAPKDPASDLQKKARIYFVDKSVSPSIYIFFYVEDKMLIFYNDPKGQPIELMPIDMQITQGVVNADATILYTLQKNDSVCLWNLQSKQKVHHIFDNVSKIYLSKSEKYLYVFTKNLTIEVIDVLSNYQRIFSINVKKHMGTLSAPDDIKEEDDGTLKILIGDKVFEVSLKHQLTIFEVQYIKAFFSKNRMFSDQDFLAFYTNYKKVYKESLFLQRYFNPILLAALKGFPKALGYMLLNSPVDYPQLNAHQISPLAYSFFVNDLACAETICNYLIGLEKPVMLLYDEMEVLLTSDYGFSKALLSKQITEIKKYEFSKEPLTRKNNLKDGISLNYSTSYYFTSAICNELLKKNETENKTGNSDFKDLVPKAKSNQIQDQKAQKVIQDFSKGENTNERAKLLFAKMKVGNKSAMEQRKRVEGKTQKIQNASERAPAVLYYQIAGQFDLSEGSPGSREFLQNYKQTEHDSFILSNWRFVIDYKWKKFLRFYIVQACINFYQTIMLTYYLFHPLATWAFALDIFVLCVIFLYELITAFMNIHTYFKDVDNYFDLAGVIIGICVVVITFIYSRAGSEADDSEDNLVLRSFQVLAMLIFYYRTMTYLKSIDYLRHIIAMLIAVSTDILDILLIFVAVIVGFALLLAKANTDPELTLGDCLVNGFLAIYGDINPQPNDSYIGWFINIFMGIFLSLILVNFLIAKMSNKYEQLEHSQIAVNYREKARIITECEIWYQYFFKRNDNSETSQNPYYFFIATNVDKYTEQSKKEADVYNLFKSIDKGQSDLEVNLEEYKKVNSRTQDQIIEEIRGLKRSIEYMREASQNELRK